MYAENIVLSERRQMQNVTSVCDSIYTKYSEQENPQKQKRLVFARGWQSGGRGSDSLAGIGFPVSVMEMQQLPNMVNVLEAAKLYTSRRFQG